MTTFWAWASVASHPTQGERGDERETGLLLHEPLLWDVEDVSMSPESVCAIRRNGSRSFAGSGVPVGRPRRAARRRRGPCRVGRILHVSLRLVEGEPDRDSGLAVVLGDGEVDEIVVAPDGLEELPAGEAAAPPRARWYRRAGGRPRARGRGRARRRRSSGRARRRAYRRRSRAARVDSSRRREVGSTGRASRPASRLTRRGGRPRRTSAPGWRT